MGGTITETEAAAIVEEAATTCTRMSDDSLARFLGVTYEQRQALHLTTIGSVNVGKRARHELRKRMWRVYQERRRRARGARPHSQSLSQTKPWESKNISRRTWERERKKTRDANSSTPIYISRGDESASAGSARCSSPNFFLSSPLVLASSRTATFIAADRSRSKPYSPIKQTDWHPKGLTHPAVQKGMNWRRARLASRPSLDHRWDDPGSEFTPDRASRWLQAVERRLREKRPRASSLLASSTVA